jgi:hypothetical protein
VLDVDGDGEGMALASMDSALVLLKERAIYAVVGDGPNDLGQGDNIRLQRIPSEIGCNNPRSVCVFPGGVLFQSEKGLYILDRGLSLQYVGGPVEDETGYSVVGTALWDSLQVLLVATSRKVLCYHLGSGEWTIWNPPIAGESNVTIYHLAMINYAAEWGTGQVPCIVCSDGEAYVYTPGVYLMQADGGGDATFTVSSPWLHFSGMQGFARVRRVAVRGTVMGEFALTVKTYIDHETAASDVYTLTSTETAAAVTGDRFQMSFHLRDQKCESMRIELTAAYSPVDPEFPPDDVGALIRWEGLTVEVGGKPGIFRLPGAARR